MKASYKLLRELIEFDWNVEELAERLTLSGSEVESSERPGRWLTDVVAVEIANIEFDTPRAGLHTCTINDGVREYRTITGAPDVAVGLKVPFARPGGKTFGGHEIGIAEIDGAKSEGMLCSGVEVGLGFPKDFLLHLPDDTGLGKPLTAILGWEDETIFELEITPNRPDCYGHWGLAREIASLCGTPWEPAIARPSRVVAHDTGGLEVEIATLHCPRYTGKLVAGVKIKPSPLWLQGRLAALGMRPINNIVDITNYVLILTGQPIHAFDKSKLGRKIVIRQANAGEKMTTLDKVEHKLSPEIMLIATPERPVAIAGIMGGLDSEVDNSTTDIVIEVAYFNPATVRRGKKILGFTTESAIRFERGTDPNAPADIAYIVAQMTEQYADAQTIHKTVDVYPEKIEPLLVTLTDGKLERLLGKKIARETSRKILVCLGLDIGAENAGGVTYRIPTFRPDLKREIDLVEEIGRIYGLFNIEPFFRAQGGLDAQIPTNFQFKHFLEDYIKGMGYRCAMTDPLGSKELMRTFADEPLIEITNPLSDDLLAMRPNPLPTLIGSVAKNLNRGMRCVRLFEIDKGYTFRGDSYDEKKYIVFAGGGYANPIGWDRSDAPLDIFEIKGVIEAILEKLGAAIEFKLSPKLFAQKDTALDILLDNKTIGYIGTLDKELWDNYELKKEVHFALLDFNSLVPYFSKLIQYKRFSRFPAVRRDIAIIVDESVSAQSVLDEARKLASNAEEIGLFDMYRGKPIHSGKKSLGLYFIFRSKERTLTDDEINESFTSLVEKLCRKFSAEIRKEINKE